MSRTFFLPTPTSDWELKTLTVKVIANSNHVKIVIFKMCPFACNLVPVNFVL